ncbi:hypothetical protein CJ030_MR3G001091 [Morella rubra]|uniref:Transmembrane protein n=1 Tax=Morella rubra TaxID=262757 RepID=A0A6A1W531_9ROSI|nr:hypothetical protein CJ030_MR3G001091 [Morella rubra]
MSFRKTSSTFIIFVILVAIACHSGGVDATRVLNEDFAGAGHLQKYSAVYEKAKHTMANWLQRLPSGPSPRGPGH